MEFRRINWISFAAMVSLVCVGTVAIWSSGGARAEPVFRGMWMANAQTAAFGLILYWLVAAVDYRMLLSLAAVPAYVFALVLLAAVLLFGSTVYGGRRWLWFFQPSEISKICVIVLLAHVFGRSGEERLSWLRGLRGFLCGLVLIGVPALLILLEPDLGTALTLVPACLLMLLAVGVWRKGLVTVLIMGALAAVFVLGAVYEAERPGVSPQRRDAIMRFVPLKQHQVRRVRVFLFPDDDISGAGYNLRQSKISIGTGGIMGKGLRKGESNHLKYLPQSISMNDFIFCVWAEETGFVGTTTLLALFSLLLFSSLRTALATDDDCGRLLVLGIVMLVFAHVFVNVAMSIGLVPITGLPLPFISSGRTFLLTLMIGFGLVQSVSIHGMRTENAHLKKNNGYS